MKSKMLYVRVVSILLTVSLLCSACRAQEAGKQPLSATGEAVLTPSGVETEIVDEIEDENEEDKKQIKTTKKDKDGTVWDISKKVTVKQDGFTYHAYLSKDGKASWIYQADPGSAREVTLSFPEEVQGAVLTKLGRTPAGDEDCVFDIFGIAEEPWHTHKSNWHDGGVDEKKKRIKKIICPPSVNSMAPATFHGFIGLEEAVMPEQLREIPAYLFFLCKNLKKITLPKKPKIQKTYGTYGWLTCCNRIREVRLPEDSDYCIKDGMLLSKDRKILYQVFIAGETVNVPEGVTRIAACGINAIDMNRIRSVHLPSTLKKLDLDAIQDQRTKGDFGGQIKNITVASNNPVLAQAGNCIYERASGTLAVFVGTKKSMTLPEEIRYISDVHSQVGKEIERLVIPASLKAYKTNQCLVKGINVASEGTMEFLSATPPEAERKGKEIPVSAGCFLIVPKEGVRAYKKWFEKVNSPGGQLAVIMKGDRACIIEKYFASDIAYKKLMKKYGF